MLALLSCVPLFVLDAGGGSGVYWYYADLALQFNTQGSARDENGPDEEDENWLPALMTLATTSNAFQVAHLPAFTDAIGFNPLAVD